MAVRDLMPETANAELTERQTRTLRALCDTFNPQLSPGPGDSAEVFGNHAEAWPIVQRIVGLAMRLEPQDRRKFGRLLDALGDWRRGWWYGGVVRPFADLPSEAKLQVVQRLLGSRDRSVAAMIRSLQRLTLYTCYAGGGGKRIDSRDRLRRLHQALGYGFATDAVTKPDEVRPSRIELGQRRLACDYLVVGSGAAGAVMAAELAETGKSVMLVDCAPIAPRSELGQSEEASSNFYRSFGELNCGDSQVLLTMAATFGGGPVVNWGTCLDPPRHLLQQWANEYGFVDGLSHDFAHSLYTVRRRLQVALASSHVNRQNDLLRIGAERLGWHWHQLERNGVDCIGCDRCDFGCPSGARQDTRETYLLDAQRLGVFLLPECRIERLEFDGDRAVKAAARARTEADPEAEIEIDFRDVVLCAGAIHTPAILLCSGLSLPHLGKNLHVHPSALVPAWHGDEIKAWLGPAQTIACDEFARRDERGFGVTLETAPLHPGLAAMVLPWSEPRQHKRMMQELRRFTITLVLCRDRGGGQVCLGKNGLPIVKYRLSHPDFWNLHDGIEAAIAVQFAAGAQAAYLPTWDWQGVGPSEKRWELERTDWRRTTDRRLRPERLKLFSAHQFSTCRMANSAARGVVDNVGRVFGTRNVFVTDASALPTATGVNPMLTITTFSHFLAQKIKEIT